MKSMKKYIIRLFIVITVLMSLINSVIQSVFETMTADNTIKSVMVMELLFYIVASISVLTLGTVMFVHKTSKKVEEENIRYNQERNMLFAHISHDLKTPITTILGFSKALYDDVADESEKKVLLNSIYEKSKKVNELLDLMFQYTKLNGLDFEMKLQTTDVGRIIRETTALYYNEFEQRNIEIDIDIPEAPVERLVDRVEFPRAVSNLLINAYRHNAIGSKVAIRLEEEENQIKVIVADNVESISIELQEEIFNPFVCEDESRNSKGGSGLGLAIAKRIVEKHGGKIYIDSNIDGYTKGFVIELDSI